MTETSAGTDSSRTATALTQWVLLTGNRLLVSLATVLAIRALIVDAGLLGIATVWAPTRVMWYLNGTVNGLLTLVPIAVGVNQIILSHEFGSIQDLHQRRAEITEFREQVGEEIGTTLSSSHASTFFGALLGSISDTARALQRDSSRQDDRTKGEIETVARSIADRADRTSDELDAGDPDVFRALVIMLDYDYSRHFDEMRRLREEVPDSGETADTLRQIEERFVEIDAARQYLKTIVVERQLARLSRFLIYTGIPAVAVAALGIFTYRDVAGLGLPHVLMVVGAGTLIAATLVPLAVLGAYILRVATIARRTAAFGPFVPRQDGHE